MGKVVKESADAAAAKAQMVKAYPNYGEVSLLDRMLPSTENRSPSKDCSLSLQRQGRLLKKG